MILKDIGLKTAGLTAIVSGIMAGGIVGYSLKEKKIDNKNIPAELKRLKKLNWRNIYNNITLLSSSLLNYYMINPKRIKPAAVIAGVPVGTALEVSHAMSNLDLKYRATGGVFLAHQEGGAESLRMTLEAFGENRYLFLSMMEFLFKWGSNQVIDMFAMKPDTTTIEVMGKDYSNNPWEIFDNSNLDSGREEFHMTFPIITRHRIYTSMYIETMDVVEAVSKGMNKLTITLFFRKFKTPEPYDYTYTVDKNADDIIYFRKPVEESQKEKTKLFFIDTIDHSLSVPLILMRYFIEWNRYDYTFEQLISFTFANRLDVMAGGTGVKFTDINFMESLLGI